MALTGLLKDELVILYRCGEKFPVAPEHCYWRLMTEHPCLRIYQLEVEEADLSQRDISHTSYTLQDIQETSLCTDSLKIYISLFKWSKIVQ